MSAKVVNISSKKAPRAKSSTMETLIVNLEQVSQWQAPPFQRRLRINAKVEALSQAMKEDGVSIPGVLTLGVLDGHTGTWIVDGQHRIEGFKMSGLKEIIADIRLIRFETMADMADEYVELNGHLVNLRPDDVLKGLEPTNTRLRRIREGFPHVGYDNVRRGSSGSPVLSMSALLRCWNGSSGDTPGTGSTSAIKIAGTLEELSVEQMIQFLNMAYAAWGRDREYYRLWSNLNLTMSMWTYRQMVLERSKGTKRFTHLTSSQFRQCLMALSASPDYIDWLQGRSMHDRDRNPCYQRIKAIFARRLTADLPVKPRFPQPGWAVS